MKLLKERLLFQHHDESVKVEKNNIQRALDAFSF